LAVFRLPAQGGQVYGCTDPSASNFNHLATVDDGSCIFTPPPPNILGCTDPTALNYNPSATQNDGSCIYTPSPPTIGGGGRGRGGFGRGLSQSNIRARYGKAFGG